MVYPPYKALVKSDLFRYTGTYSFQGLTRHIIQTPGFKYTVVMRAAARTRAKGRLALPLHVMARYLLHRLERTYGISIPYNTQIGFGLYIGHFGGIVVSYEAIIGRNCNINHGVTIGATYGGRYPGVPRIGNNVYLGPGSKIIGGIVIGNNVAVGANAVVTTSVPDNAVVIGVPGRVASFNGSFDYVNNTVGEDGLPAPLEAVLTRASG